ncbi:MAG TPA: class D sortase [Vicinamibacterales bacterium]|nr:class D sortase [Vicinamibacterales bacterium]
MTRHALLTWLERTLIVIGVALGIWCAKIWLVARYTQSLPIPEQYVHVGTTGSIPPTPAPGSVIGRFEVPRLHLSSVVLEGSDDATLAKGAGHIEDTPFPGEPGNIGIAGHRDTIFRPIRYVKIGDEMDLKTADRVYRYRVTKTFIVKPEDVYVLDPTPTPTLTLVTCWPFEFIGHAPKRFIVQAELAGEAGRAGGAGKAGEAGKPGR